MNGAFLFDQLSDESSGMRRAWSVGAMWESHSICDSRNGNRSSHAIRVAT